MRAPLLRPCVSVVALALALLAAQQVPAATVGVFPFRVASPNAGELQGLNLRGGLPVLLAGGLAGSGAVEAEALPWPVPAGLGMPPDTAPFGSFVAAARHAGVEAFVMGVVTQFDLAAPKQGGGGLLGQLGVDLPGGGKGETRARAGLEGGLVDSLTEQVLVPLRSHQEVGQKDYTGAAPADLAGEELTSETFQQSLPGQATAAAVAEVVGQVTGGAGRISPRPAPEPRADAPAGLSFTQSRFSVECPRAANQWAAVEVYNAGNEARRFAVEAGPTPGLTVGLTGSGSTDEPCTLPPMQWKRVRLVVTADFATGTAYGVPLLLYDVTGEARPDLSKLEPHDTATAEVHLPPSELRLAVRHVVDEPTRLGQTFEITNQGADAVADLTIRVPGDLALQLSMAPTVDHYSLAAGETLQVSFQPVLSLDFAGLQGQVLLCGGGQQQPLPLSFQLPAGKHVFLAEGASKTKCEAENEYCTNMGGGNTDIGGPQGPEEPPDQKPPPDKCKHRATLRHEIEMMKYIQGLYDSLAPEANDWDDLNKRVADRVQQDKGVTPVTAGQVDGEGNVQVNEDAFKDLPEPVRTWYRNAVEAHEQQHQTDLNGWKTENGGATWKFTASDPAKLAETEHRAYDKSIESLQKELDKLNEECPPESALPQPLRLAAPRWAGLRPVGATAGLSCLRVVDPLWSPELSETNWGDKAGYYLATTFTMPYSRSGYSPHDTLIALNGNAVGRLTNTMPEGIYLWPVDPQWLNVGGHNVVSLGVPRMNAAHYIIANSFAIISPVTARDRLVVASSQKDANKLYGQLPTVNHDQPDLLVAADPHAAIPPDPKDGEEIRFKVTVWNVGAGPSKEGKLRLLDYDPRESQPASEPKLERGLSGALDHYLSQVNGFANPGRALQKKRFKELGDPLPIAALDPDASADLEVVVTYKKGETTRLCLVAETKDDFDPTDNVTTVTFVAPEGASPLVGTDYPDLFDVPLLSTMLDLPLLPEVETFTGVYLEDYIYQIPYLRELRDLENGLGIHDWLPF